jgi:hypothetical protein
MFCWSDLLCPIAKSFGIILHAGKTLVFGQVYNGALKRGNSGATVAVQADAAPNCPLMGVGQDASAHMAPPTGSVISN